MQTSVRLDRYSMSWMFDCCATLELQLLVWVMNARRSI